jgi:hypothetical protein
MTFEIWGLSAALASGTISSRELGERQVQGIEAADSALKRALWWICLLVAPAILVGLELFHPAGFTASPGMYEFLSHAEHHEPQYMALGYFGPNWWLTLHMIQTPLVGLVAVGLWMTVAPVSRADGTPAMICAWLARVAIFVMAIYFTVLDGIGGISLGRTIVVVQRLIADGKLSPAQLEGVVLLLNTMWVDPLVGGLGSFVSLTASWAAFSAAALVAAALLLSGRAGWLSAVLLVAFGWELQTAHAAPHGPIAFSLLILATLSIWWTQRRRAAQAR